MKTQYFTRASIVRGAAALLILPFQMLPVAEGSTQPQDIEVADIARLCVRVNKIGATGIGKVIGTEGETRYEIDGSELKVYLAPVDRLGEMTVVVDGNYGEIKLHAVIFVDVKNDAESEVEVSPYIFSAIAAGGGGGADYKTDIYMDGAGRVILERLEDGSTIVSDEHENLILKRNADGSTQYFDAYQSARLLIGADGVVSVNYTEDETVKTLQLAEAILARTRKRLLTNTAGEENIKDEDGNILTHADIYAMLMESPDFVVLVRSDHAFHPNLVTPTQIAFTCSYIGADGAFSTERVNITSEGVFSHTNGKAPVRNAVGGLAIGNNCEATGANSFAEGYGCKATGAASHAEGTGTIASGQGAHAEGSSSKNKPCEARGENSHAEGLGCTASGKNSHAEGEGCISSGANSHAEGDNCTASGANSHVEGYVNSCASLSHVEGALNTISQSPSLNHQHVEGIGAKQVSGQGAFVHGCGSNTEKKNACIIKGSQMYLLGVGGFDGTNETAEGVLSLQQVLAEMLNPEAMTLSIDGENAPRVTYKDKPIIAWTANDLAEYNEDLLSGYERNPIISEKYKNA